MLISASSRKWIQGFVGFLCCFSFQFSYVPFASAADCIAQPDGCCKTLVNPGEKISATTNEKLTDAFDMNYYVKGMVEKKTCPDGTETYFADCVCELGGAEVRLNGGLSYAACDTRCLDTGGKIVRQGIGLFQPKGYSAAAPVVAEASENAACFTKKQCTDANPEAGAFVISDECTGGMGKCRAPEADIGLSIPIGSVKSVKNVRSYIQTAFQYALTVVGIVAAIMLIWGGFKYVIGSSAGDVSSSKKTMQGAIIGLILLYVSWTLLNALNPATLKFDTLDIYLTNKVLYDVPEFCVDYKPAPGKTLRLALSGKPPGSIVLERAIFDKKAEDTIKGESYYIFGFGTQTCKGKK